MKVKERISARSTTTREVDKCAHRNLERFSKFLEQQSTLLSSNTSSQLNIIQYTRRTIFVILRDKTADVVKTKYLNKSLLLFCPP